MYVDFFAAEKLKIIVQLRLCVNVKIPENEQHKSYLFSW